MPETDPPAPITPPAPRLPYMPGVDGLRALAVASVFVFHAGATWLPGGFLGVDVFLVISGYLITALLLAEHRATGTIRLTRFWVRRARRLLPALFLMLAGTLTAMVVLHHGEVARLKGAVLSSLGYVTNWYFVLADVPYYQRFERPNVFLHLWSLAVEEQFYLVWPLVMALVVVVLRGRPWTLLALSVVGALASAEVVRAGWRLSAAPRLDGFHAVIPVRFRAAPGRVEIYPSYATALGHARGRAVQTGNVVVRYPAAAEREGLGLLVRAIQDA